MGRQLWTDREFINSLHGRNRTADDDGRLGISESSGSSPSAVVQWGRASLHALALHCDIFRGGLRCRFTHLIRRHVRLWLRGDSKLCCSFQRWLVGRGGTLALRLRWALAFAQCSGVVFGWDLSPEWDWRDHHHPLHKGGEIPRGPSPDSLACVAVLRLTFNNQQSKSKQQSKSTQT